jgi:acyl-CoA synthetase (AMP-forming)/AMP-acid ligase II
MPRLTLDIPDVRWARVVQAFTERDEGGNPVVPTAATIRDWLLAQLKDRVEHNALGSAQADAIVARHAELEGEGW